MYGAPDFSSVYVERIWVISIQLQEKTEKNDINSASGENWKEPSLLTKSIKASFNGDSNEETLQVNKTCWQ